MLGLDIHRQDYPFIWREHYSETCDEQCYDTAFRDRAVEHIFLYTGLKTCSWESKTFLKDTWDQVALGIISVME